MLVAVPALLLLCPLVQDAIERGTPWYWPVGEAFEPGRILQGYGQYETVTTSFRPGGPYLYYAVHKGLDVKATVDEAVRAPIAGTVLGVYTTDPYGSVILGAEHGDWGLTVTHLYDITVKVGDEVEKGQQLGFAVEWTALPTFTHVHLGVFAPQPDDVFAAGAKVYVGDPLVFLGGRPDTRSPSILDIDDGADSYWPVAFVDDVSAGSALTFHAPGALPQQRLDILAHVNDYFTTITSSVSLGGVGPFAGLVSLGPHLDLVRVWEFTFDPALLVISKVAPACLSVRITRDSDGKEVYQSTVEFTGEVSDSAYLEPSSTGGELASAGWPDPDFYFLLTHSESATGAWDTSDATAGGPGSTRSRSRRKTRPETSPTPPRAWRSSVPEPAASAPRVTILA